MTTHQARTRYDKLSQLFHWLTALAVVSAFALGPGDFGDFVEAGGNPASRWDIVWHETLGITVFVITLARLLWVAFRPSAPKFDMPVWMRAVAGLTHWTLWGLLLALPLTALLTLASENFPLTMLGNVHMATIPVLSGSAMADWFDWGEVHTLLGDAIVWLAGAHAVAAIVHHVKLKDGVLASMLP